MFSNTHPGTGTGKCSKHLWKSLEWIRKPWNVFRYGRVFLQNPNTPRIKISCLWLRTGWQVYIIEGRATYLCTLWASEAFLLIWRGIASISADDVSQFRNPAPTDHQVLLRSPFLGGLGAYPPPPENLYISGPLKWHFFVSECKFQKILVQMIVKLKIDKLIFKYWSLVIHGSLS